MSRHIDLLDRFFDVVLYRTYFTRMAKLTHLLQIETASLQSAIYLAHRHSTSGQRKIFRPKNSWKSVYHLLKCLDFRARLVAICEVAWTAISLIISKAHYAVFKVKPSHLRTVRSAVKTRSGGNGLRGVTRYFYIIKSAHSTVSR